MEPFPFDDVFPDGNPGNPGSVDPDDIPDEEWDE